MAPPYVSPLREAQAAETRRRVLDSAARVFATGGYAGTSMTRIAADAGVSVETVKQNGSKPALLLAAFSQAFSGVEDDTPLHRRPALDAIRALPDDEFLTGWLEFVAAANRRVAGLWPRLLEAALVDGDAGERVAALQRNRRADMESVIRLLRERGLCRSTLTDGELATAVSFLISPESWTQLVEGGRWTQKSYIAWLVRAVERIILAP